MSSTGPSTRAPVGHPHALSCAASCRAWSGGTQEQQTRTLSRRPRRRGALRVGTCRRTLSRAMGATSRGRRRTRSTTSSAARPPGTYTSPSPTSTTTPWTTRSSRSSPRPRYVPWPPCSTWLVVIGGDSCRHALATPVLHSFVSFPRRTSPQVIRWMEEELFARGVLGVHEVARQVHEKYGPDASGGPPIMSVPVVRRRLYRWLEAQYGKVMMADNVEKFDKLLPRYVLHSSCVRCHACASAPSPVPPPTSSNVDFAFTHPSTVCTTSAPALRSASSRPGSCAAPPSSLATLLPRTPSWSGATAARSSRRCRSGCTSGR